MSYPHKIGSEKYNKELEKYKKHNKPTKFSTPDEEWTQRDTKITKKSRAL